MEVNMMKKMSDYIETPAIGEILQKEFMEPMEMSACELALTINVPAFRIRDILDGRRKITADISPYLAKLFGVSDDYFLDMQNDIDMRNLKQKMRTELSKVQTI